MNADNAINALGNLPAGNDFAQPPLNAEGSEEPTSNDPTQHPTLHPFVQHDAVNAAVNPSVGNENIIVGDYHIEGVADIIDIIGVESRRHVTAFYEATIPLIENASQSNRLMIKSKFELIKETLLQDTLPGTCCCEIGIVKVLVCDHRLGRVTAGKGNNVELNGLTDALNGWESMKIISEREAARKESIVGGQGKGDVTCSCKGKCNTNHCSCKKAGRICSSACHRNNFNCCNHVRRDLFMPK
jgi:hypothetical protein